MAPGRPAAESTERRLVAPAQSEAPRQHAGLFQAVLLLWAYALYDVLRAGSTGSTASALAHARQVVTVERFVGLDAERAIQRAALHLPWLVGALNLSYTLTHLAVPPLVLWLLYQRAPARYRHWRNVFFVLLAIGVLCFWLYPMAPPRLLPGSGVVDTSHTYASVRHTPLAPLGSSSEATISEANPFAAMPSLHVGWAVWALLAVWPVLRRRSARLLVALYPALMLAAVVVTGNHWLLDCVGGVAATLLACGIVSLAPRVAADWRRRRIPDPAW